MTTSLPHILKGVQFDECGRVPQQLQIKGIHVHGRIGTQWIVTVDASRSIAFAIRPLNGRTAETRAFKMRKGMSNQLAEKAWLDLVCGMIIVARIQVVKLPDWMKGLPVHTRSQRAFRARMIAQGAPVNPTTGKLTGPPPNFLKLGWRNAA